MTSDYNEQEIAEDVETCFLVLFQATWQFGVMANVCTIVRSTHGHPPQTRYTHKNRYRRDRDVIKEMEKGLLGKKRRSSPRWRTIRRVQIFRVELCIIVTIIIPSPPPISFLTDSMIDSLLSLSLSLSLSVFSFHLSPLTLASSVTGRLTKHTLSNYINKMRMVLTRIRIT